MDQPNVDMGAGRTARELRFQLAQMTAASQVLECAVTDERGRRYLAMMDQSICRMLRIVGRLELSEQLSGGPERLDRRDADLTELTKELGERLSGLLAYAGVELTVKVPEGPAPAWVDEGLVRQLIMELVSNAAKVGEHVTLTLARRRDRAVFTVEDDGPGIPPERLAHLFSSAEEAVPDWRRAGVGVAIARQAAALHGGTVVADCAPGRGLRAVASIPLGAPEEGVLASPGLRWDPGGFDEALVALSDLLPPEAFGPDRD